MRKLENNFKINVGLWLTIFIYKYYKTTINPVGVVQLYIISSFVILGPSSIHLFQCT